MRATSLFLATALLLAAGSASAQTAPTMLPDGTILEIAAEGHTTRIPDVATIRAGVTTQGQTAAAALGDNAARMARVLAALTKAGVAARDVRTANVSLSPQYRYADGQAPVITGYQASNSVSVRFRDVARSGTILDALVAQGANQIDGPNLSIDQPDAALDEARMSAVKIARARRTLREGGGPERVADRLDCGERIERRRIGAAGRIFGARKGSGFDADRRR